MARTILVMVSRLTTPGSSDEQRATTPAGRLTKAYRRDRSHPDRATAAQRALGLWLAHVRAVELLGHETILHLDIQATAASIPELAEVTKTRRRLRENSPR